MVWHSGCVCERMWSALGLSPAHDRNLALTQAASNSDQTQEAVG